MLPSHTPTAGSVHLTTPPLSWITSFPPPGEPAALAPPHSDRSFARPFNIDSTLYNDLLHVSWPTTIAIVYACTVAALNRLNRQRDHKPWAISRSSIFYVFVLLHNIALAVFSFWTCAGMIIAVRQSWPRFSGEGKWAQAADALCKINGPRGLGSAATFNGSTGSWGFADHTMKLLDGSPDSTDVGRLWNEGLAFYGWLFYVSKFYEVVDTLIILAKGKTSSVLQTFHHAGAMMCMWAGIRYMSPPIWMFVLVNSGLHGLMVCFPHFLDQSDLLTLPQYTYYALSTLEIQVPQSLKRFLTALQISQFIIGASYAVGHLFVAYSRPVSTPYLFIHNLSTLLPTAASSLSSAVASATASAGLGSWLKKAALRAAGEEGLAENVRNAQGEHFGIDAVHSSELEKAQEEMRWRSEYQMTHCLDTPGQAFAILLNALYLAPLTILFAQFFIQRYITGTKQNVPPETKTQVAKESARDAIRDLEAEIKEAMNEEQHADEGTSIPPEVKAKVDAAKKQLHDAKAKLESGSHQPREKAGEVAKEAQAKAKDAAEKAQKKATDIATKAKDELQKDLETVRNKAKSAKDKVVKKGEELKQYTNDKVPEAKRKAEETKDQAKEKAGDVKDKAAEAKDQATDKGGDMKDQAKAKAGDAKDKAAETKDHAADKAAEAKDQTKSKATEAKDSADKKKNETQDGVKRSSSKSKIPKRDPSPVKRESSPQKKDSRPGTANGEGKKDKPAGKENQKADGADQKDAEAKKEDDEKDEGTNGLDESAYEVNPDEVKSEEEERAERAMQPKSS